MVKSIAEKHGLRATFMPKPFAQPHRQRLPRARLAVEQGRQERVRGCAGRAGPLQGRPINFIGGLMHSADALCRHHQSDRQLLQAHQCAAHHLGRHLVAQHRHLRRQQPHAHDPHPRRRPLRAAPGRRRDQSLPAAGGAPVGGARRHEEQARSGQAPRHRHVRRGAQGRRMPSSCRSTCSMRCARSTPRACSRRPSGEDVIASYLKLQARPSGTSTPATSPTGSARRRWIVEVRGVPLPLTGRG